MGLPPTWAGRGRSRGFVVSSIMECMPEAPRRTRLAAKRPWHVVAFVFGFRACGGVSVQHCARRFEAAWQLGWWCPSLSWHPRYQTPCHGVKAKLEVLKALLTSPSWVAHQLEVRIVRSSHGGMRDAHARRRENKYRAHLHPYPVTTVDHL